MASIQRHPCYSRYWCAGERPCSKNNSACTARTGGNTPDLSDKNGGIGGKAAGIRGQEDAHEQHEANESSGRTTRKLFRGDRKKLFCLYFVFEIWSCLLDAQSAGIICIRCRYLRKIVNNTERIPPDTFPHKL